jgi:hypothetical protein
MLLTLIGVVLSGAVARAEVKVPVAGSAQASPCQQLIADAAAEGKYAFVLFWKNDDRATRTMEQTLDAAIAQRADRTACMKVQINDRAEQALVARFDASRSPMPLVMALAPNGAVTGAFPMKLDARQVDGAIMTPASSDMIKALQSKKITLVCLQPAGWKEVPQGVVDFEADPHFQGRTHCTVVQADDPAEAGFVKRLRPNGPVTSPVVAIFAPPGVHVGTYQGTATAAQLSKAIHDAGQCGPNCKHHHHHK